MPFFSICIPVYKNVDFLKRLLDSTFRQSFKDFEVIITDDSPDDSIEQFLNKYYGNQQVFYFKNPFALGTPENWNEGIRRATGTWIKIMHDDDWFSNDSALQTFYNSIKKTRSNFYFSAYNNVFLDQDTKAETVRVQGRRWKRILNFPPNLYARNVIGPPSVTMVKNDKLQFYDNRMKWLVDIDYYIRLMKHNQPVYINDPIINVGIGSLQVTTYTHNKPEVEIPEGLLLFTKVGNSAFNHILYFDAWWRLIRNVSIRNMKDFKQFSGQTTPPESIKKMIIVQSIFPGRILRIGLISKLLMAITWTACRLSN